MNYIKHRLFLQMLFIPGVPASVFHLFKKVWYKFLVPACTWWYTYEFV